MDAARATGGGRGGDGASGAIGRLLSAVQEMLEPLNAQQAMLTGLYRALPVGDHEDMVAAGEVVAGVLPENIDKNRYSNICPFDARRVVLRRPCSEDNTDYINASHIELPGVQAIASQGPTHPQWHGADTTGDFWAAVWEQGCEVIVALAKVQPGFSGSARYWPEVVGQPVVATGWPRLSITLLSEEKRTTHFTTRRLQLDLAGVADTPTSGATSRVVTQLHYDRWPNYGVPQTPDDVAALLRAVEAMESARLARTDAEPVPATAAELSAQPTPPLWVHCSGGVGRTGVFLTALSMYRSIFPTTPTGTAPPAKPRANAQAFAEALAENVASLRRQRHPWMVEGGEQYLFAHKVVLQQCATTAEITLSNVDSDREQNL